MLNGAAGQNMIALQSTITMCYKSPYFELSYMLKELELHNDDFVRLLLPQFRVVLQQQRPAAMLWLQVATQPSSVAYAFLRCQLQS